MPKIPLAYKLFPGTLATAAKLNQLYNDVATLVNTTKLDGDNFRSLMGIVNAQKQNPYAIVPIAFNIPDLQQAASVNRNFRGLISVEHYAKYPIRPVDQSKNDGKVTDRVKAKYSPFQLVEVNGCYHGATSLAAGDVLQLIASYRVAGDSITQTATYSIKSNNTLVSYTPILGDLDYLEVYLLFNTDATAGTRDLIHVGGSVWLKVPHIR